MGNENWDSSNDFNLISIIKLVNVENDNYLKALQKTIDNGIQ